MSNSIPLSRAGATVVIGGGIAGATIAYELTRRGAQVTLLEERSIANAASGRNLGLLLNQVEGAAARVMQCSLEVYRELESAGLDFSLRRSDQLLLARDHQQWEVARGRAQALAARGVTVRSVEVAELRRTLPALAENLRGGWVAEGAWALDPAAATVAFVEAARRAGADIRTGVRVHALRVSGGRAQGVLTDTGPVAADAVVVATGPWLPHLVPALPVAPGRGWVIRTRPLGFDLPWIVEEMAWTDAGQLARAGRRPTLAEVARGGHDRPVAQALMAVQEPRGEALIGTSLAPSLSDAVEGADMPRQVAERALLAAPGLAGVEVMAAWSALRPMTPDGLPLVGAVPGTDRLWVHGGHGSSGMRAAPATARWLVEDDRAQLERFAPARFS